MIKKLARQQIDVEKYSRCIQNSIQRICLADLEFLDVVCKKSWEILVKGDYEAVMPVYVKKRFGINYVISPPFINQLGIFSKEDNVGDNQLFLDFLLKNYNIRFYSFNACNTFQNLNKRRNFLIKKNSYENVRKNYSVHRRRNSRLINPEIKISCSENFKEFDAFFNAHAKGMHTEKIRNNYTTTLFQLNDAGKLKIYQLYKKNILCSLAILSDFEGEMALLHLISDKKFASSNDASILLDQIFRNHIEEKDFNFHGSNIESIAEFFRRFGAVEENYAYIQNSKLQLIKNVFKL